MLVILVVDFAPIYTNEEKKTLKKEITKRVGANIRQLRKNRGLSMEQLAYLLDSNKQNIYKIENGLYCPTIATLLFISNALECDLCDLMKTNPKPTHKPNIHGLKFD